MSNTLLQINNLKTHLFLESGVLRAVDGVDLKMERGETVGIVGESGSGKSMTAFSVIKLLPRNVGKIVEGEIVFDGKDVLSFDKKELREFRGKDVATIFQEAMSALDPVFKIGSQMIQIIRAYQDITPKEAKKLCVDALRNVGIPSPENCMNSYPHELSGGMCQRVIIAIAICKEPKLVIADEPTTALDVTVQAQVLKLLKEMQSKSNTAILLITHDLGVIWDMCDKVMVMYAGKTVEYSSTNDLYLEPLHPYTWGLLDSTPKLSDESKTKLSTIPGTTPNLQLTGGCCNFYNRCPYAQQICFEEVPEQLEIKEDHFVACHRQTFTEKIVRGETDNE